MRDGRVRAGWRTFAMRASALAAAGLVIALAWAALAPIEPASRDQLFEIPPGTWARRMAGDKVEIQ